MKKNYFRQRDWIPRTAEVIREECLDAESLEFVLLSAQRNRALYGQFEDHLLTCERCIRRVRAVATYYRILESELQQPASPRLVELARTLAEPVE
jgi:hypothetical protein